MESDVPTKLSKFPTPFSIESLIANHHHQTVQAVQNGDSSTDCHEITDELSARAMVASSALGLTNFPLYNPWLHGYFAQNHDRISQLLANTNGDYMTNGLIKDQSDNNSSPTNPTAAEHTSPPLKHSKSSQGFEAQLQTRFLLPPFGLGTLPSSITLNESILQQSANLANELTSRQKIAEMMANGGLTTDNVQNLTIANRFAHKVFSEAALSNSSNPNSVPSSSSSLHIHGVQEAPRSNSQTQSEEASVDVVDEDYDCSGDSCSDISLTMSPQNYRSEVDKTRGKFFNFNCGIYCNKFY